MTAEEEEAAHQKVQAALADLDRQQQRLGEVRGELAKASVKTTSPDKMLTVELDPSGEIKSVKFNSRKYCRMAPAELSAVIVETIRKARAQSRDQIIGTFRAIMPAGTGLDDLLDGQLDLDKMFAGARRQGREIISGPMPGPQNGRKS